MSWSFMDPASRGNIDRVWRREAGGMLALAADPEVWEAPTGAGHWQVRDVIGHLVDTTEAYFPAFEAARGRGTVPEPLGLPGMAKYVDEGARTCGGCPGRSCWSGSGGIWTGCSASPASSPTTSGPD
jgi:hypothetical protein